ncbi:hypothetical protein BS78_05G015800 [Paspalum vaginatum]|nr:hypothetical protein BS78_05G015800 [Paspalum vaginatum]
MARVHGSPPWSDLLPELLGLVFLRLRTRTDRAIFPAVCRAWCSAARQCQLPPPPSPVPWLARPSSCPTTRATTPRGDWILLSRDDHSCFLMNPFTEDTMPLPRLSSYTYYEEPVEVPEGYHGLTSTWMQYYDYNKVDMFVPSLVVCPEGLIAAIVAIDGDLRTIALCRPGSAAWSVSAHEKCRRYSHMVFFQGKLYALDTETDLIAIDILDERGRDKPRVSRIEFVVYRSYFPRPWQYHFLFMYYLLESYGSLLMTVAGSSTFQVFKADFERHVWAEVTTLGNDQALFLGQGCSRAVRVSPSDLSGDCIFFLDDYVDTNSCWTRITTSCGLHDMKDERIHSPLPMVSWRNGDVPATWVFWQDVCDRIC